MSEPLDDFIRFLAVQRAEYHRALPAKLAAVEAAWRMIEADPAASMDAIERQAHNLAGSAGTFGFDGLSEAAKALERAVQSADRPRIAAAIAALKQSLLPDA